ncbi:hypothetical protein [Pseudoxanthomonas suwonensis]|jgi:hypothetical protein|uniref:hypothetical protein n=1 Tax=Pseudoxanthomonas suwonensis TaxID=314722 RepID=UPI0004631158|nr:hypothetical protein [Pseudoxanthomonas suwonensis]
MSTIRKLLPLAICASFALAACKGPTEPAAPATGAGTDAQVEAADVATEPSTEGVQGTYLQIEPLAMETCAKAQSVKVDWDLGTDFPGVTGVQVFVGADESSKLFSAGGAKGTTQTGNWVRAGTIFRLVNKKTGEEIERVVVGSKPC